MRHPGPLGTRVARCLCMFLLSLPALMPVAASAADGVSETEVRAVFLYNFASFVRWPDAVGKAAPQPFRYCVLDDDLAPVLDKVLRGERIEGRALTLVREVSGADLPECHVLYVGRARLERGQGWELVRQGGGAQVLTVSDLEGFEGRGGMVALVPKDRRIRPVINIDAVERAALRVSAKLLGLATVTRDAEARN